jgi:hypothetical protein
MRLNEPLLKLPIQFCSETLVSEIQALPRSAWVPHPTGFVGNEAVRLVTPGGKATDELEGPMAPTEHLLRCPYIMEVMAELGGVWGRSRLMGLAPGADVPSHIDIHYYWRTHLRIHIPVITNPGVRFTCDDESVHMAAGECWVFDSFRRHGVRNRGSQPRVHLVLDTVGGERIWDLVEAAQTAGTQGPTPESLAPGQSKGEPLFEQMNAPTVMSPWEMKAHIEFLAGHALPNPLLEPVMKRLDKLLDAWGAAWAQFGAGDAGFTTYRQLITTARHDLDAIGGHQIALQNERPLVFVLVQLVFANAVPWRTNDPAVADNGLGSRRLAS